MKIVGLTGDGLEAELRGEFEVREETFAHGGFAVEMLLPKAPDALIDTEAYETDERLPYWAELWPSARGLARHLLDHPPADASLAVVELGCGLALPSLALRWLGMDPLATDWYDDALRFARVNAERNGLPPLRTAPLDWRHPPGGASYDLVLAADVLYERRNAESLAALLPQIVAPGGRVLLADPGRVYLTEFKNRMYFARWRIREVDAREEADPVTHRMSTVRVFELRRTEQEVPQGRSCEPAGARRAPRRGSHADRRRGQLASLPIRTGAPARARSRRLAGSPLRTAERKDSS